MTDPEYRVVCPDGVIVEEHLSLDEALVQAATSDQVHDGARCIGPHRVERCLGWEPIA